MAQLVAALLHGVRLGLLYRADSSGHTRLPEEGMEVAMFASAMGVVVVLGVRVLVVDITRRAVGKLVESTLPGQHLGDDIAATLEINPNGALMFLIMSINGLQRMGEQLNDVEMAFNLWCTLHYPTKSFVEQLSTQGIEIDQINALEVLTKQEFLEAACSGFHKISRL